MPRYRALQVSIGNHKFQVTPDRTVYDFNNGRGLRKVKDRTIRNAVLMKLYELYGPENPNGGSV